MKKKIKLEIEIEEKDEFEINEKIKTIKENINYLLMECGVVDKKWKIKTCPK